MKKRTRITGTLTERLVAEGRARTATRDLSTLPKPLCIALPRPLSAAIVDDRSERLDELIEGITPSNRHGETPTERRRGGESW